MGIKIGHVLFGPLVWIGKSGPVIKQDHEFVVLAIESRDDGGRTNTYDVRFPLTCVEIVVAPPIA